jgi:WD40 repeat protein
LDVHPSGDHVISGSYDKIVNWFDLDLSSSPYKALRYHKNSVRQTSFHGRYPLMATCSDDGNIHIFHAMVYSDLLRNPLVVPLTILRGDTANIKVSYIKSYVMPAKFYHEIIFFSCMLRNCSFFLFSCCCLLGQDADGNVRVGGPKLGILDCLFHPSQPWVFGASADNNIRLFQNIH